jgi:uncharacterized protein (TIGR04562 family)
MITQAVDQSQQSFSITCVAVQHRDKLFNIMASNPKSVFRGKYDFRSDVLDVIIGGKSTLDSPASFQIQSAEEADNFIRSYGYDVENPIEKAEILGNFHEALNFIRKYFLKPENPDGLKLEIPRKIMELNDLRDLILMVSETDTSGQMHKNWACSILKIMHTIAHIDKDLRSSYFTDIQKQIFDRFYKLIHRDSDGNLFLGDNPNDPLRVNLVAFETKPKKSRDSIILKLLHKPENVAEDIFDRVGIRFITPNTLGALQVVKALKDKMVVMPPNIKPSRSRNTLVQTENFRAHLGDLLARADRQEITEEHLIHELENAAHPTTTNLENPHSSQFYRAIQFTCRQLIKLRNPLYDDLKELKNLARTKTMDDEVIKVMERIDLKHVQREIRFFYPFEVQVVDTLSADENEKGRSAHSQYKKAQIQTALLRVMGSLADAATR